MEFLKKIQNYFETMELKRFYRYIGIFIGILFVLIVGLIYYHHRTINNLQEELQEINSKREQVRNILERAEKVRLQKKTVDAMLAEDENFKISGYFEDLLKSLGLWNKLSSPIETTSQSAPGQTYGERILTAQLADINMLDLTKLLDAIEQKKRIYTKELDITTSKKTSQAIDVTLTIATLQPVEQITAPTGEQ